MNGLDCLDYLLNYLNQMMMQILEKDGVYFILEKLKTDFSLR